MDAWRSPLPQEADRLHFETRSAGLEGEMSTVDDVVATGRAGEDPDPVRAEAVAKSAEYLELQRSRRLPGSGW